MIRLKRMIDTPKGQIPAPLSAPMVPLSRLKSAPKRTSQRYIRLKKANAVVIRAMKQPQNRAMDGFWSLISWLESKRVFPRPGSGAGRSGFLNKRLGSTSTNDDKIAPRPRPMRPTTLRRPVRALFLDTRVGFVLLILVIIMIAILKFSVKIGVIPEN